MVTGDNKLTATAIAKECGILPVEEDMPKECVMEGPEFYEKLGGLICRTCTNEISKCQCDPKKR